MGAGQSPYVRLGTSWGELAGGLPSGDAPYNRTALVDVLLHTVMHYNEGYKGAARYYEVWNEPDSQLNGGRFWNRSAEEFYDLVDDTAPRSVHPRRASRETASSNVGARHQGLR